ncbi:superoxide dismutase 1 copper chaperone [Gossypium arboreum]|uniref:Superoxide dismutase 1 copper chaperone n=1 Tax=Gossypium arboreum TaxID=29729 RepID=A0A0B0N118_GOSAR|nr:superoxide dismutase 1 copper chaperone [Gossypium arboreum]
MGEEKREESKGKQDETNKEEEPAEIVLKVDMHCEACARKVARALKGFQGVEDVATDSKANKVVVKGKTVDPITVCERLRKKSGRKVELISPLPKPPSQEEKKEENKELKEEKKEEVVWVSFIVNDIESNKTAQYPKHIFQGWRPLFSALVCLLTPLHLHFCTLQPWGPPAAITVVLKVHMHCEACAQVLRKRIRKIPGVETVDTDVRNHQVIVKGVVDPANLVDYVYKRTRKQVSIVKDEENKEEEKKEAEKKQDEGEKKEEDQGKGDGDNDKKMDDIKRSEYYSSKYYSEFAYPPQFFSDENPNACSLM